MEEKGKDIREHILFNIVMFIVMLVIAFILAKYFDKHPYPETKVIVNVPKQGTDTVVVYKYINKPTDNKNISHD